MYKRDQRGAFKIPDFGKGLLRLHNMLEVHETPKHCIEILVWKEPPDMSYFKSSFVDRVIFFATLQIHFLFVSCSWKKNYQKRIFFFFYWLEWSILCLLIIRLYFSSFSPDTRLHEFINPIIMAAGQIFLKTNHFSQNKASLGEDYWLSLTPD